MPEALAFFFGGTICIGLNYLYYHRKNKIKRKGQLTQATIVDVVGSGDGNLTYLYEFYVGSNRVMAQDIISMKRASRKQIGKQENIYYDINNPQRIARQHCYSLEFMLIFFLLAGVALFIVGIGFLLHQI